jgi:uncharacterized protein (TIGR02246 family)
MRARILGALIVAAAIGLAACSGPKVKEFGKPDQEAIRKLVREFVTAYNAKDVEKIGTLFAGNSVLMPANRSTLRGVDLLKLYYDERFKSGASNLQLEPQDLSGHGTIGYVTATFSLDMVPPGGGVATRDRGKVLWIVHDFGGQWRFEYQVMSSDLPPAVSAPAVQPAADTKK